MQSIEDFVQQAKDHALEVLRDSGPEAAIEDFLGTLKQREETANLGIHAQVKTSLFEEHWRGGNDEHDENGLVALWINDFVMPQL